LKKVKKSDLICANTTTKTKVTKVRVELKTFGTADLSHICYATTLVQLEWFWIILIRY